MNELRQNALHWLACSQVVDKVAGVTALNFAWQAGDVCLDASIQLTANQAIPGHPSKPVLVSPLAVEKRSMRTLEAVSYTHLDVYKRQAVCLHPSIHRPLAKQN